MKFADPLAVSKTNGAGDKITIEIARNTFFSQETWEEIRVGEKVNSMAQ